MKNPKNQRKQIRLKNYDYSQSGWYFITICIQDRECILGHIKEDKMVLNEQGKMVEKWLEKISDKFNVILDEYQIMPNHIHTIIHLVGADPHVRPNIQTHGSDRIGSTHGSTPTLGTIIQWFKTISTNEYMENVRNKKWKSFNKRLFQRNYYEHIVRNEQDLHAIRQYIQQNPLMWTRDRNNLSCRGGPTCPPIVKPTCPPIVKPVCPPEYHTL